MTSAGSPYSRLARTRAAAGGSPRIAASNSATVVGVVALLFKVTSIAVPRTRDRWAAGSLPGPSAWNVNVDAVARRAAGHCRETHLQGIQPR